MSLFTIYHNSRCSKSREALGQLQSKNVELRIREYLKEPLNEEELLTLLKKMGNDWGEGLRKKEQTFKALSESIEDINSAAKAIAKHPIILERPIVECEQKALVCRPLEKIEQFF